MSKNTSTKSMRSGSKSVREQDFVGTWDLQSWQEFDSNGNESFPFGPECFGRLNYTEDGFMNAVLMQKERAEIGVDTKKLKDTRKRLTNPLTFLGALPQAGALARYAKATSGYVSYGGRFRLNQKEGVVVHMVDYSLIPDWIGGDQVRKYTFSEDGRLTLEVDFGDSRQKLVWQRL